MLPLSPFPTQFLQPHLSSFHTCLSPNPSHTHRSISPEKMEDSGSSDAGGFFTQKTPILGQKLFIIVIATVVVVVAAFALILLLLRSRSTRRRRIGVNQSSGLLPLVFAKSGDEREADQTQRKSEIKKVFVIGGVDAESESKESSTMQSESSSAMSASTDGLGSSGWGRWFSMRELQISTNQFSSQNVIGEGGYGIVYRGVLQDGSVVAVKNLLNNKYVPHLGLGV